MESGHRYCYPRPGQLSWQHPILEIRMHRWCFKSGRILKDWDHKDFFDSSGSARAGTVIYSLVSLQHLIHLIKGISKYLEYLVVPQSIEKYHKVP